MSVCRRVSLRLVFPLLLIACAAAAFADEGPVVSSRLQAAFDAPDFPWREADGRVAVWVHFRDRGLSGADLEAALDRAEAELPERTAKRRAKMLVRGERVVNGRDLPVFEGYLDRVRGTGAVFRRTSRWLNAATFEVDRAQLAAVAELDCVRRVDLMAKFVRPEIPVVHEETPFEPSASKRWSIDYGGNLAAMEQANVPPVHEMGINGQGVIIGMLDSGFRTTHEAFASLPVLATWDFVNDDGNVDNETGDPSNSNDHGTKTLSTAAGYAPGELVAPAFGASVILAKTEDVSQEVPIEEDQWVAGLEWVELQGADLVSSSLGYYDWYTFADLDGATAVTTVAADLAVGRGLLVINSAGNERGSFDHIIAPADGDSVIAVGAVTSSGTYTYFSSPGPSYDGRIKPDVSALGSSNHVVSSTSDTGYTSASGTSFSCPLTAGVAALVLSRAPSLTPMQVRDALRETADRAHAPDNDYGWGIIDAHAAVNWFGPGIDHAPQGDTEAIGQPLTLTATVTDRVGLVAGGVKLVWRVQGGVWNEVVLTDLGGDLFTGDLPGQPAGTTVEYYIEAAGTVGVTTALPFAAPAEFFTFTVGYDTTPPVIVHAPLRDQAHVTWPPVVACTATDNLGLDRVELRFSLNGGAEQGPFPLIAAGDDWSLEFPLSAGEVAIGDALEYTLTAVDGALTPNATVDGPHAFAVIDVLGVVVVLEDAATAAKDEKFDADKRPLATVAGKSNAASIAGWLTDAGYVADVRAAAGTVVGDLAGYQAVVYSAGSNSGPMADATLRTALLDWVAGGGKLLVEGGEVGYDALSSPGYADIAANVLHTADWDADNAGDLAVAAEWTTHPLLLSPNVLPSALPLAYVSYGDNDAVEPAADAYRIVAPASHPDDAGILIHDDNPAPQSAQIVYFAFNLGVLDAATAPQLVENALAYLLAAEAPPTASLGGRATLQGQVDHSGILVDAGGGRTTTTDAQGDWSLPDLYAGAYSLTFSYAGFATETVALTLADGEHLTGVDATLEHIHEVHYSASPAAAIPDNSSAGVSSVITVSEAPLDEIQELRVSVDVTHTYLGDLTLVLTGPDGTAVTLHARSGGSADDLVGEYPETLTVDGPGALSDFVGLAASGDWTLQVTDSASYDTGTLNSWGLDILLPDPPTAVDGEVPRVTRLGRNAPNPFNPSTEIAFALAESGRVRLAIYDLRGTLVRTLVDEHRDAGEFTARWDGRDDRGRSVGSGAYLYRLRGGGEVLERKMLLVR